MENENIICYINLRGQSSYSFDNINSSNTNSYNNTNNNNQNSQINYKNNNNNNNSNNSNNKSNLHDSQFNNINTCYINYDYKGYKLISNQLFNIGQVIFTEKSLISIPIGKHYNRICWKCLKYGHNKVKISSNSNYFYFCSNYCLDQTDNFINLCHELITSLLNLKYSNNMILCIKIIYQIEIEKNKYLYDQINKHEQHKNIQINELDEMISQLLTNINQYAPTLIENILNPYQYIESILRCLQFNSQPHNIISLVNTQYLCFYSNLSRLNHSCNANTVITYHVSSKTSSIVASLVAIRPISINEELTISYLSEYCQSYTNRQNLLLNGFQFRCECVRCIIEQKYFYFGGINDNNNHNGGNNNNNNDNIVEENEIPTIICNDNSYYITDLLKLKSYLNEFLLLINSIQQKVQFLVILQNIFQQINEKIQFIKLQWRSLLKTVTQSLTADRIVNHIQTKQIFYELNQIYQNFYYYYEINLLLFFYVMTEKNIPLNSTNSSNSSNSTTVQLYEYQIKREIFLVEICKLIKFCLKLSFEFSEMKVYEECPVGILWNSQSVLQILLTGGGSASRLITNGYETSHNSHEISEIIDEGSKMIQECQNILSQYYNFNSDIHMNRIISAILPTNSNNNNNNNNISENLLNEIKNNIKHEYSDIKDKIEKIGKILN